MKAYRFLRLSLLLFGCFFLSALAPQGQSSGKIWGPVEIQVRAVDMLSQKAVPGAQVIVKGWDLMGLTDTHGVVLMKGLAEKALMAVEVTHPRYMGTTETLLTWDKMRDLTIELPPLDRLKEASELIRFKRSLSAYPQQILVDPPDTKAKEITPANGVPIAALTYPLPTHIKVDKGNGSIVTLPLEEYLKGVLPREIGPSFPAEAQKAQAVAARTYTISYTNGGQKAICITTRCQVWGTTQYASTTKAVLDTKGQVAVYTGSDSRYKGKLAGGYFAASCGGETVDSEKGGWSFRPFLRGVTCIENKKKACTAVCKPSTCNYVRCPSSHATCWGKYGHRIGMCQRGAQAMAYCNKSYVQIIMHYYTDTEIANRGTVTPTKDDAALISEEIPAGTTLEPGKAFTKSWTLENRGDTTWTAADGYKLVRLSGESFQGGSSISLGSGDKIAPKQQKKFSISLKSPASEGTYTSQWQMDHKGKKFGPILKISIVVKKVNNCVDNDKDGYFAQGAGCKEPFDCNDNDKNVHPGAKEICGNGKDDDCKDGDAKCPPKCIDNDKDGYPVQNQACPGPYDCDDNNKDVYPGAREVCGNGKDDDCQGGDAKCPDKCVDNDKDGYFVKNSACNPPYDCDDNDKSINPGTREICGNGKDDDCQGGDAKCPDNCKDNDKDGYFAENKECAGPYDCNDNDNSVNPGKREICGNGKDDDCKGGDLSCEAKKKPLGEYGCTKNSDCTTNLCVSYQQQTVCSLPCGKGASPCPDAYTCIQEKACWPKGDKNNVSCSSDADCPSGICYKKLCISTFRPRGFGCSASPTKPISPVFWMLLLLGGGLLFRRRR